MAIKNTVSSNPRSSIVINVKSVFDCRLSGVKIKMQYLLEIITYDTSICIMDHSDFIVQMYVRLWKSPLV